MSPVAELEAVTTPASLTVAEVPLSTAKVKLELSFLLEETEPPKTAGT